MSLRRLRERAAQKDQADRFQTALEFAEEISRALAELQPAADAGSSTLEEARANDYVRLRRSDWFRDFPPEQVNETLTEEFPFTVQRPQSSSPNGLAVAP